MSHDLGGMECIGVDLFIISKELPKALPRQVGELKLDMVSNRGTKVSLETKPGFAVVDWYRCRFRSEALVGSDAIRKLIAEVEKTYEWEKAQKLYRKDGKDLFSKASDA